MKKISTILFIIIPVFLIAQQEGKITYKEKMSFKVELSPEMQQYADLIPTGDESTKELKFDETQSIYEETKIAAENEAQVREGGATTSVIRMGSGGAGKTYFNTKENLLMQAQNMMGQPFLVSGDIPETKWKVLNEQKEILGRMCIKAEHTRDSTTFTAWFAPDIPLSIGPANWRGLPGAILEVSMQSERVNSITTATEIIFEEVTDSIIRPKKGKKVTRENYEKIVAAKMEEMNANQSGNGPRVIIKTMDRRP